MLNTRCVQERFIEECLYFGIMKQFTGRRVTLAGEGDMGTGSQG